MVKQLKAGYVEPMKALAVAHVPLGGWLLENKFDGYRALAVRRGKQVRIYSRNRHDLTGQFPEIAAAVGQLDCREVVLDGEIVAVDSDGRPRFQLLQRRMMGEGAAPMFYYLFDLLHIDGVACLGEPIEARKRRLQRLLIETPAALRLSPVFELPPDQLLAKVRSRGMEGIVAKAAGSVYEPGRRSGAWLKCRVSLEQEFVIGGFTAPQRSREHFGAILVGYYRRDRLVYAGKVGTGFDRRTLAELHGRFRKLEAAHCSFDELPPASGRLDKVTWLRPRLIAQIRFSEWTGDGLLRQPVYLGLRRDKSASEVVREVAAG